MEEELNRFSKATLVKFISEYHCVLESERTRILRHVRALDRKLRFNALMAKNDEILRRQQAIAAAIHKHPEMLGEYSRLSDRSQSIGKQIDRVLAEMRQAAGCG